MLFRMDHVINVIPQWIQNVLSARSRTHASTYVSLFIIEAKSKPISAITKNVHCISNERQMKLSFSFRNKFWVENV